MVSEVSEEAATSIFRVQDTRRWLPVFRFVGWLVCWIFTEAVIIDSIQRFKESVLIVMVEENGWLAMFRKKQLPPLLGEEIDRYQLFGEI
jgi:hypothetical protein